MQIEPLDAQSVKIILTAQEMDAYALCLSKTKADDPAVHAFVREMLQAAEALCGFRAGHAERMLAQLYADRSGGCTLYLTAVQRQPHLPGALYIYRFSGCDDMIAALVQLFRRCCHRVYKSALYRMNGCYYVAVDLLHAKDEAVYSCLSEYGEPYGKTESCRAFLKEHADEILSENAMDVITYYLA